MAGRQQGVDTTAAAEIHRQTVKKEERTHKVQEHFAVTDPMKSACARTRVRAAAAQPPAPRLRGGAYATRKATLRLTRLVLGARAARAVAASLLSVKPTESVPQRFSACPPRRHLRTVTRIDRAPRCSLQGGGRGDAAAAGRAVEQEGTARALAPSAVAGTRRTGGTRAARPRKPSAPSAPPRCLRAAAESLAV